MALLFICGFLLFLLFTDIEAIVVHRWVFLIATGRDRLCACY